MGKKYILTATTGISYELTGNAATATKYPASQTLVTFRDIGGTGKETKFCGLAPFRIVSARLRNDSLDISGYGNECAELDCTLGKVDGGAISEADTFAQFKLTFSKWGDWEKKDILVKPESDGDTTKNRPCRIALETTSTFFIYDFNVQSDMVGQNVIPVIDLEIETDCILDASTGLAI